jgi:hypothetical protein
MLFQLHEWGIHALCSDSGGARVAKLFALAPKKLSNVAP